MVEDAVGGGAAASHARSPPSDSGQRQKQKRKYSQAARTRFCVSAPPVPAVPEGGDVRKVDLSIELQILAYHQQRKASTADPGPVALDGVGDAEGLDDLDGRVEAPA